MDIKDRNIKIAIALGILFILFLNIGYLIGKNSDDDKWKIDPDAFPEAGEVPREEIKFK